jgi:two-component system, LytTR family, sensor histidine kinase AlgZ
MLLLPLTENAMKHGPLARRKGKVILKVSTLGDLVRIEISNPGAFTGRRDGGSGISIVEKRIALAYGDRASFAIEGDRSEGEDRTRAVVAVPRR